jgi:energy-coupling factor transporter transmembrane protein EcfT
VVDPGAAWVASNTPMSVVQRVSRSDTLASAVSLRTIDSAKAEARVRQLRLNLMPIEDFVGTLLASPQARP